MSAEQMKATIQAAAAAFNAGDVDGYLSMYDSSLVHHGLGSESLDEGGNRAFYESLSAGFPGCQLIIDDMLGEEDRVAVRLHFSGEHEGEFLGVAPTQRPVRVDAHTTLKFKDGHVVERWTTADLMGLMNQIS
jgi:predicted ester cyclase